jgi:hypothetical protein
MVEKYPVSSNRVYAPKDLEKARETTEKFKNISPENR